MSGDYFQTTKFVSCHPTWNPNNELGYNGIEYLNWDVFALLVKRERGKGGREKSQLSGKEKLLKMERNKDMSTCDGCCQSLAALCKK